MTQSQVRDVEAEWLRCILALIYIKKFHTSQTSSHTQTASPQLNDSARSPFRDIFSSSLSPSLDSPFTRAHTHLHTETHTQTHTVTSCGTDPCSQCFLCFTKQLITGCYPEPLYNGLSCLYLDTKQWLQIVLLVLFLISACQLTGWPILE